MRDERGGFVFPLAVGKSECWQERGGGGRASSRWPLNTTFEHSRFSVFPFEGSRCGEGGGFVFARQWGLVQRLKSGVLKKKKKLDRR